VADLADFFRWQWMWKSRARLIGIAVGAMVFRWQWMWKSRARLIGIAVGAMVFGAALILYAVVSPGPFNKGKGLVIAGGVMFAGMGGFQLLQGVLSPAGAFGERDRTREVPRLGGGSKWKRKGRPAPAPDDAPLPVATDTHEPVKLVRCPACTEAVSASAAECPKCFQRLMPE
jgi:hypothetical protein